MLNSLKAALFASAFFVFCQTATADIINVTLDTTPLMGHPAGPFSILFVFTDGDGIGDSNNAVTINNISFGGGSALGGSFQFGGASGSLAGGVTIDDSFFLSLFSEAFVPGNQLTFTLSLTTADDAGGIPDRLTFSILDALGSPIPTLAPAGDFFLGADLGSAGAVLEVFGSDPSRAPSVGSAVSIAAPTITAVPEPTTISLLGVALAAMVIQRRRSLWRGVQ